MGDCGRLHDAADLAGEGGAVFTGVEATTTWVLLILATRAGSYEKIVMATQTRHGMVLCYVARVTCYEVLGLRQAKKTDGVMIVA